MATRAHTHRDNTIFREGLLTGVLGLIAVAVFHFVLDMAGGRPFYTPRALGSVFVGGGGVATGPAVAGAVVYGTGVLFVFFVLAGVVLAALARLTLRDQAWRMGVWLALVISSGFLAGLIYMLGHATGEDFPILTVAGGALAAMLAMGLFVWRRHPGLRGDLSNDVPLGDQPEAPPAPPGGLNV
jgi:hypothetical protein